MSNISPTILSIAPGTRELGVAVFENDDLLFYSVKTVSNRKSPRIILEAINNHFHNLVKKYRPGYVAIERVIMRQNNYALLAVVADQIKATAKELNLPVSEYTPASVRKRLCQTGRATKRKTAGVLAARFPELKRYYLRETKGERDYYSNLFDAVALGVIGEEGLVKSKTSNSGRSVNRT